MLANSDNGQELVKHLIGTMKMAMRYAEFLGVQDPDLINIVGLSGFLHDIGKCTKYFQNMTLANDHSDKRISKFYPHRSDKKTNYPRHNEISWLYSIQHAKAKSKFHVIGPQAIYWHHGTLLFANDILDQTAPRNTNTIINILNSFQPSEWHQVAEEIESIIKSVKFPFDISKYLEGDIDESPTPISRLFVNDDIKTNTNSYRMIVRSCVIVADHLVSKLTAEELDDLITNGVDKYFPTQDPVKYSEFKCQAGYDQDRFEMQREIVRSCERTTLVKAPAGYGKSLIGLMWGAKQQGQIYWVCPRNSVAEGVYQNLLREIKTFGLDISIELFLTSERKDTNSRNIEECNCDIVVTNIDNLLSPMVDYKSHKRVFDILARNVVLDEFHEFINDEALFGAFLVYMKARNLVCMNSNTLLLSATPGIMHQFWDTNQKPTKILPNDTEHYPAQHTQLYTLSFDDDFVTEPAIGSLTMYSSIRNVQQYYSNGYNQIVHSNYSDSDRRAKMQQVFDVFGKGDKCTRDSKVISAPILQAALDISFSCLYKTIESPESDIQTFGRINRWGEQKAICQLHMLRLRGVDRRERSAITERYQCNLSDLWSKTLEEQVTGPVDLNFLYRLYNSFNQRYNSELVNFITKKYLESIDKLQTFFPRQRPCVYDRDKKFAAKTLRNSASSFFIVVRRDGGTWCDFTFPITELDLKDLTDDNRDKIQSSTIATTWEVLEGIGEFDYSELKKVLIGKKAKKKLTVENIKRFAKCSESPLPIFSWHYDSELGLIK